MRGNPGQVVVRQAEWVHRKPADENVYRDIVAGRFPRASSSLLSSPASSPRSCADALSHAAPTERDALASQFSLLHTVPAADRLPPNLHPALLFSSSPGAIPLSPSPSAPVERFDVPHVPGAFLLTDVLSPAECRSILAHAEAVGFRPDQPVDGDQSVLAHNLYWLADTPFLDTFCARFLHLCPQLIDGKRVRGINARFRGASLSLSFAAAALLTLSPALLSSPLLSSRFSPRDPVPLLDPCALALRPSPPPAPPRRLARLAPTHARARFSALASPCLALHQCTATSRAPSTARTSTARGRRAASTPRRCVSFASASALGPHRPQSCAWASEHRADARLLARRASTCTTRRPRTSRSGRG